MASNCTINLPLLLLSDTIGENKKFMHTYTGNIEFPNIAGPIPVNVICFVNANAPEVDEVVSFWSSFAHGGVKGSPITVYATNIDRFDWVDLTAENYLDLVPSARQPMIVAHGQVEGAIVDRTFMMGGTVYGDGKQRPWKLSVTFPGTPRWANTPNPSPSQWIHIQGKITSQTDHGVFTVEIVTFTFGLKPSAPSTPSFSAKRRIPSTPGSAPRTTRAKMAKDAARITVVDESDPATEGPAEGGEEL